MNMDKIFSLRAYVAITQNGSFSAAARELNVAPSVVTKRINELEREIGAPLFKRCTRSVSPTPLGTDHLELATQLLHKLDKLIGGPSTRFEDIEGHLRVKVPPALAMIRLGPAFARFQRMCPKIDLAVTFLDRHISPLEDSYDLAIGLVQLHPYGVVDEMLCPLRRLMCASPDYLARKGVPVHPRELSDYDCMTSHLTQFEWMLEKDGELLRWKPLPKFVANDVLLLLTAALQGNGITLLPDYVISNALKTGELVRVLPDWTMPSCDIRAIIPKHRASDLALRLLLDFLREEVADIDR